MEARREALRKEISLGQAVALYFGSVLGTGILISPALAATEAGPASLWVWIAFAVLSYPVAVTLGELALRHPSAGGVSVFVREAFGPRAGAVAGWLFLSAFAMGSPAAALVGAAYLGPALGLAPGSGSLYLLALGIASLATLVNLRGVTLSGRTQVAVMAGVSGFLLAVIVAGLLRFDPHNLQPLAPRDIPTIGLAGATIFWSFLGWENAIHAAEELRDPSRDLRRAIALAVVIVGVLYFLLALATVGARAYYSRPDQDAVAFVTLLADLVGPAALVAAGALALLVTFATINAYTLGVSRLLYGMARDGGFPSAFHRLHPRTQVPTRTLLLLYGLGVLTLGLVYLLGLTYEDLFLLVGSSFIVLYMLTAAAGLRLFRAQPKLRAYALVTLIFFGVFLALVYRYALYPAAAVGAALLFLGFSRHRRAKGAAAEASNPSSDGGGR